MSKFHPNIFIGNETQFMNFVNKKSNFLFNCNHDLFNSNFSIYWHTPKNIDDLDDILYKYSGTYKGIALINGIELNHITSRPKIIALNIGHLWDKVSFTDVVKKIYSENKLKTSSYNMNDTVHLQIIKLCIAYLNDFIIWLIRPSHIAFPESKYNISLINNVKDIILNYIPNKCGCWDIYKIYCEDHFNKKAPPQGIHSLQILWAVYDHIPNSDPQNPIIHCLLCNEKHYYVDFLDCNYYNSQYNVWVLVDQIIDMIPHCHPLATYVNGFYDASNNQNLDRVLMEMESRDEYPFIQFCHQE
jgi:hypothetical protein